MISGTGSDGFVTETHIQKYICFSGAHSPTKRRRHHRRDKKQRKRERKKKAKTLPEFQHNDIILDCHTACTSLFFPRPNSLPPREKPFRTTHLCYRYKSVTWCFMPSQPLWLYQGNTGMRPKNDKRKQRTDPSGKVGR